MRCLMYANPKTLKIFYLPDPGEEPEGKKQEDCSLKQGGEALVDSVEELTRQQPSVNSYG